MFDKEKIMKKMMMMAAACCLMTGATAADLQTEKSWNILDYGAREGDVLQTAAIQRAIDACYKAGGGVVRVPAGFYRTGGIRLRSRVTLHLMSGAVLEGSRNPEDYEVWRNDALEPIPPMSEADKKKSRSAVPQSRWCNGLIRAYGAHDVAIIGEPHSLIDGQNCFDDKGEEGYRGPHAISMWNCTNVVLRGYTIRDSANWAHAIFNSSNITARALKVVGGHDGFDIRTCDDVIVEKCVFKTGDDAIAGFDNIGVTIRDCVLDSSCSALRFGGTDVLVENCTAEPGGWGFRGSMPMDLRRRSANDGAKCRRNLLTVFLYYCDYRAVIRRTPGNIVVRNCNFKNPDSAFALEFDGKHIWCCNRSLSSITYENCTFDGVDRPIHIHGDALEPLSITLRNCTVVARKGFEGKAAIDARNYKSIRIENTEWKGFTRPRIEARTKGEIVVNGGTPLEVVSKSHNLPYEAVTGNVEYVELVKGFGGAVCENGAQVSKDGNTLTIDGSKSKDAFVWRRFALATKKGLFAAKNRYEISFDARVEELDRGAFLYALVRPSNASSEKLDVGAVPIHAAANNGRQHVSFTCEIAVDCDYRLQFHSRSRIKAELKNLKVRRVPPMQFTAIAGQTEKWTLPQADVPTGAKEFDVDLPQAGTGIVLNGEDFGIAETNTNNTPALLKAIAEAKRLNASRLEIKKGFYKFTENESIRLEGLTNFTFNANGSTFRALRRRRRFMEISNCMRTRVMNFKLDWDWTKDPLASLVQVTRVDEKSFDFTFVDYERFPRTDMRLAIISAFDPKTRSVGIEDGVTRGFEFRAGRNKKTDYKWVSPNVVRVNEDPKTLKVGQLYRLQHYYYDMDGINLTSSEHVRLENIDVLSTPGHAFAIHGTQKYTLFDNVNIVAPKDDVRRVITCTADHLHVASSCGFIKMQNCEFSLGADDIFNMHDCTGFARKTGPRTVRTQNARVMRNAKMGAMIELRNGDYSPTGFFGKLTDRKVIDDKGAVFDLTFDRDVPEQTTDGFVLFDWTYDTHNVIVRNCFFHDNRARGLLILARDVTIENNRFRHHEMGAIKIETGYTFNVWSEGYGVSNVVIRGNVFDNVNPSGSGAGHRQRSVYTGIYLRRDPSPDTTDYPIIRDILFEGNTFRDSCGVIGYLTSVKNITFRDNVFEDPTPRKKELDYRGQFYLSNARDVHILNNTYISSPSVKSPGVEWDPLTCERILIRGNGVK